MHYIYYFEIAAFVIIFLVAGRHFSMRKFNNVQSKLFSGILIASLINTASDVVASIFIDNAATVPIFAIIISNFIFYFSQIIMMALVLAFMITISTSFSTLRNKYWYVFIPSSAALLLLLSTPLTGFFFKITEEAGIPVFTTGLGSALTYIHAIWALGFAFVIAMKNRSKLSKGQLQTVFIYSFICLCMLPVQALMPEFLLTGLTMACSILLMSYNLQNPSDMLDNISYVFNFKAFQIFLNDALEHKRTIHVIAIDASDIERYANIFGTKSADELSKQVGDFLNKIADKDWAFKISNCRYVLASFNKTRYFDLITEVRERFDGTWILGDTEVSLFATICHGIETNMTDPDETIGIISATLDDMKGFERGKTKVISTEIQTTIQRKFAVEALLRKSIQEDKYGFYMLYQPIYDLKKEKFIGAEALLRMRGENGEVIMPGEFIPIAEITGLIRKLDRQIVEKVCRFLEDNPQLYACGLENIHINLSAGENFANAQSDIHSIVESHRVTPQRICFEITETSAMNNIKEVRLFMKDMDALGYRFAMDDFGTGYSNISGLSQLPFDVIKLDKTLIPDDESGISEKVFSDMVSMIKDIGKNIVVEGAETEEQVAAIRATKADFIQGYYYSTPIRESEFVALMEKQK